MWFKSAQLFNLSIPIGYKPEILAESLKVFAFKPCLPSLPYSIGWGAPLETNNEETDNISLVHAANGYILFCLQIEEKILPSTVVQQEVKERVRNIEECEGRKVYNKEKQNLKEEIYTTLLPKAFSKHKKIYAYLDTHNNQLILGTTVKKYTEWFLTWFKKSIDYTEFKFLELKSLSTIMTSWLKHQNQPQDLMLEEDCALFDPNEQGKTVRCKRQDLTSEAIKTFIEEGSQAKQLRLTWKDQINFVLTSDFHVQAIRFEDNIVDLAKENYAETKEQQFDANFVIMTQTLTELMNLLKSLFIKTSADDDKKLEEVAA